jgi:hypothetical protein
MVSTFRLYLLRATYLLIVVGLGTDVWPAIINHSNRWDLWHGVGCSLLGAVVVLAIAGLRYPLKMLPLLLFELTWKSIWLAAIALPLWSRHQLPANLHETVKACLMGIVIFPLAIPWPYVFATFFKAPAERNPAAEPRRERRLNVEQSA